MAIIDNILKGKPAPTGEDHPRYKHGEYNSREYHTWAGMKQRCCNPTSPSYERYGARGIRVCDRWFKSFEDFFQDMGECPDGLSIDRIDNEGDYSPKNCRWTDPGTQSQNRRNAIIVTHKGLTMCLKDWAIHTGIQYKTLFCRYKTYGWSVQKTLEQPVQPRP